MKISEQFAGSYFKATDLPQPRVLTIQTVTETKMPDGDTKPVVRFVGESLQLVLNKTNAFVLVELFGDETAVWIGQPVELFSTTTSFSGRMVPCIRVRAVQQPAPAVQSVPQQQPAPQPAPQAVVQAAPQQSVQPQPPVQAPAADYPMDA